MGERGGRQAGQSTYPYNSKAENPKSFGDGDEPLLTVIPEFLICAG